MQVVFGILMLVYIPDLDPYPGYLPIGVEVAIDKTDYQTLPGGEQLCPERHASILSSKCRYFWIVVVLSWAAMINACKEAYNSYPFLLLNSSSNPDSLSIQLRSLIQFSVEFINLQIQINP